MKNEIVRLTLDEAEKYKHLMSQELSAKYFLLKFSRKYREKHNVNYLEVEKSVYESWKIKTN